MIKSQKARQSRQTTCGDLSTPVAFYKMGLPSGLDLTEKEELVYQTYAEVYNPSMKDIEVMNAHDIKKAMTLKIRDPFQTYQPQNRHKVIIKDERYQHGFWEIVEIRPDFHDRRFITILLTQGV